MNGDTAAPVGATCLADGGCRFRVWAPHHPHLELRLLARAERAERRVPLAPRHQGYHEVVVPDAGPGDRYLFVAGDTERPDPAARSQPDGVHGPSEVVGTKYPWTDVAWGGLPLEAYLFYELHVGAFAADGTFDGAIDRLDRLVDLGITAVEVMPVAQFPGTRNWGYDGVYPFAVQHSYGGPLAFKRFVDACHRRGLAVVLDVVYNHLGPEGNYLGWYGPYFTDVYRTPWGQAINFDQAGSDEVRSYFIQSALQWVDEFHVDALRLDAVHAIHDQSAIPFLEELGATVHARASHLGRRVHLIAESDLNDARLITPRERGGLGMDAQWADDLHHALHHRLTRERAGYYQDYPEVAHLAAALRDGYAYTGQHSAFRGRRHGRSTGLLPPERFVVCSQNHDQVGNRMRGERLSALVDFERLKLAAATVLLAPGLPLLFMGEEYGETAPFPYFVDHGDPALLEAVRKGRAAEFAHFRGDEGGPPDPADPATFEAARLRFGLAEQGHHGKLWRLYRRLIALRRGAPELACPQRGGHAVRSLERPPVVQSHRHAGDHEALLLLHYGERAATPELTVPEGRWIRLLDTAAADWGGPGSGAPETLEGGQWSVPLAAWSAVLYVRSRRGTRLPW